MKAPSVELILALDKEYRTKAAADQLKKIAPKKLNPEGKTWLPVMSANRDGWRFTLLFSNTQRAHDLGKTMIGWLFTITMVTANRNALS